MVDYDYDYDYLFKIILIGDSSVGKSSIVERYVNNEITDSYISTIGVDFRVKTILLDGKYIKLQIWDTAGQEKFRAITKSYYRCANAVIIVFDLTERDSYNNIDNWIKQVKTHAPDTVVTFLVGNKTDLINNRVVSYDEAQKKADDNNIIYRECSAKTAKNIESLFRLITEKTLEHCRKNNIPIKQNEDKLTKSKKRGKCC